MKLSVISWKWHKPNPPKRSKFISEHVNILKRMVKRNLTIDHEFVCITDSPDGLDNDIRYVPLFKEFAKWSGCYPRLKMFSKEIASSGMFEDCILSIDLDVVIVDNITPLINFKYDFIISRIAARNQPYNGSFWFLRLGSRPQIWDKFSRNPLNLKSQGFGGTDQAWMAYILGSKEKTGGPEEGVYGYRRHIRNEKMPENARLITFQGRNNPWDSDTMNKDKWISRYRQ